MVTEVYELVQGGEFVSRILLEIPHLNVRAAVPFHPVVLADSFVRHLASVEYHIHDLLNLLFLVSVSFDAVQMLLLSLEEPLQRHQIVAVADAGDLDLLRVLGFKVTL